jgi:4-hydroxy-tetrahydrodipicolinate synthase
MLSGVYDLMKRGETEAAHCLFNTYLPLLRYEAQGEWGIAIRKKVMRQRGAMECAALRAPGPTLGAVDLAEIGDMIARMNIGFQSNSHARH